MIVQARNILASQKRNILSSTVEFACLALFLPFQSPQTNSLLEQGSKLQDTLGKMHLEWRHITMLDVICWGSDKNY